MDAIMETYTGRRFDLANPDPSDVCIKDIAHHLSQLARFNGAPEKMFSVAQHSVGVADLVWGWTRNRKLAAAALMHDGHEAYTGDTIRPVKLLLQVMSPAIDVPAIKEIEDKIQIAIEFQFNLNPSPEWRQVIKKADDRMLQVEAWNFIPSHGAWWENPPDADVWTLSPLDAEGAEFAFLERWKRYGGSRA